MNTISSTESITSDIKVVVHPEFIGVDDDEFPNNVFGYRITITNNSNNIVTLTHRSWKIIDADCNEQNVFGEGVVGYTPRLEPSMTFTYSSMCPIKTLWGTMEGYFIMQKDDGSIFHVLIDRFFLIHPTLITNVDDKNGTKQ